MKFRGIWLQHWMYGQPYAAETNFNDLVALAKAFGFDGVCVKAMDGLTWMGDVQSGYPDAIRTLAQIRQQREAAESAGVQYACWVNPLFGPSQFLLDQADAYSNIGIVTGCLWWDTEPYAGFWGPNRDDSLTSIMLERFRAAAPDCLNVWQPDPRRPRLLELGNVWGDHMNVLAGQTYWTDFGAAEAPTLDAAYQEFLVAKQDGRLYADAEWSATLPGNADPEDLTAAMGRIGRQGAKSAIGWRVGTMGPAALGRMAEGKALLAKDDQPPSPNPVEDLKAAIRVAETDLQVQVNLLKSINDQIVLCGQGVEAARQVLQEALDA